MKEFDSATPALRQGAAEGRVVGCPSPGAVLVEIFGAEPLTCSILESVSNLRTGDHVLVLGLATGGGVVVGRITDRHSGEPRDELVIEAGKVLTLKVGDGSITIREDGKILIKGTHLVSHAKKMNRIRGGSVTIN